MREREKGNKSELTTHAEHKIEAKARNTERKKRNGKTRHGEERKKKTT